MSLKDNYRSLTIGMGVMLLSGCYAPYGGYPPGAYAPQYPGGPPVQYQGVPQSSYVMPGDTLGSPASVGSESTFAPAGNLKAPTPAVRNGNEPSQNPVPLPRDPDPSASRTTPVDPQTSQLDIPSGSPQVSLGAPAELDFQSPIVFTAANDQSPGGVVTASDQSAGSTPSGHDPNYNWFQGRLEYVEADQSWHLTYDDAPDAVDQLGGDITLSQDVKLNPEHNGDVVRVTGTFDDSKLDRLKKPIFRVSRIDPL